jgi:Bifunctional DNA primase/polymerase, N-terminal
MTIFEAALDYVYTRKLSIIPVIHKTKQPLVQWMEYQRRMPTSLELSTWFGTGSENGIGIITGEISDLIVIDITTAEEIEFATKNNLLNAPTVKTSRGLHLYYRNISDPKEWQKWQISEDSPRISGEINFVIAPPSVHSSGITYEWVHRKSLNEIPIHPLPRK